jgi:hypothetical protein
MARSSRYLALGTLALLATLVASVGAEDGPPRLVGPFTREDYPQAVIDRPLTLPAGMVEAEIGGTFVSQRFGTPVLGVGGADDWDLDVDLRIGLTDRIQLGVGTAFSLDHTVRDTQGFQGVPPLDLRSNLSSWQRVVPLRLSVLALDTETLDTAVTLTLPFVAHSERTIFFGRGGHLTLRNGDGRVLPAVLLAAPTRWRLTDWLWLRAGQNLFAVTTGDGTALFAFDFGIGVQPHRLFAVTLDTRIAAVVFDGAGEEFSETLADRGTMTLEGTFAPIRGLDLVGGFDLPDVGRGIDNYALRTAVRVRF